MPVGVPPAVPCSALRHGHDPAVAPAVQREHTRDLTGPARAALSLPVRVAGPTGLGPPARAAAASLAAAESVTVTASLSGSPGGPAA